MTNDVNAPPTNVKIRVETKVYVTEEVEKVKSAIYAIFDKLDLNYTQPKNNDEYGVLFGEAEGVDALAKLRQTLRRQKTLDAARSYLLRGLSESGFRFELNKQAAYAGWAVFCSDSSESPLGSISVSVECDNPMSVIDWLATPTIDGVPIDELGKRNIKRKTVKGGKETELFDDF